MSNEMKDWMRDNLLESGDSYCSDNEQQKCCGLSNYGRIMRMDIYELAQFLDSITDYEGTPWAEWFEKTFCDKCKTIKTKEEEYTPCDLNYDDSFCACAGLYKESTLNVILAWLNPTYLSKREKI